MLGWALNRTTGNASTDAPPPGQDDTIEQPDTPAPVFAARAFKRAIFGTPGGTKDAAPRNGLQPTATHNEMPRPANADSNDYDSPSKPTGILLTPGTGTSRRKRVSFGREVKSNVALGNIDGVRLRPRTRLQEALENSRRQKSQFSDQDNSKKLYFDLDDPEADDAWEEVDDFDRDPDITVDLNEPRSQSGRYWKTEFQKYHDEARAEMEKLVKYKQLAKSYAKAKDAEALDLNERLREEQDKVLEMEKKITELAARIGARQGQGESTRDDRKLLRDLSRETALAVQYRNQVEELEALLKGSGYGTDSNRRRRGGASGTAPTLEDQREMRKARERLKELSDLRQELQRVKSNLSATEQRERKLELEKRKLSADLVKSDIKVVELERKLSKAENDRQRKDNQYEKLKAEYDALKGRTRAHTEDFTGLRRSQRTSKAGNTHVFTDNFDPLSTGNDAQDPWANTLEDLETKLRDEQEARRREMEDASVTINNLRQEFKRASGFKSLDQRLLDLGNKSEKTNNLDDITHDLLQSRVLREKKQTHLPLTRSASRVNKRKASGPIGSDRLGGLTAELRLDPPNRQRNGIPSRGLRASTSTRGRSSGVPEVQRLFNNEPSSPAISLARDRSQARKLDPVLSTIGRAAPTLHPTTHFLLLLSDSALPLGSFAFSSGLESYLAHNRRRTHPFSSSAPSQPPPPPSRPSYPPFDLFLPVSVSSYASTTLPFVLAAHRGPDRLADLDDQLDASVICTVGKRASVAQGRALLGIWERSFAASTALGGGAAGGFSSSSSSCCGGGHDDDGGGGIGGGDDRAALLRSLGEYSRALRSPPGDIDATGLPPVAAHLAPLFGVICRVVGLSLHQTAYVFMLGHVKALISAAVRANLFGPYQAQRVLAGSGVQEMISAAVEREWDTPVEEAGQSVPVMDLWIGRHELLYSRIFNS
ncbi:hypothetical protein VMCG_02728 [Cytospora schulzeri]|uniref:Spindle pole body-associated protein cut12 domain-containing protein n=1 Tax=Cytospora schulzeri TaxID=448051 RepID=A0A423WYZ7_9PEZI|nr:hypothetical protein VMCG_02728 [Valsa malicola]